MESKAREQLGPGWLHRREEAELGKSFYTAREICHAHGAEPALLTPSSYIVMSDRLGCHCPLRPTMRTTVDWARFFSVGSAMVTFPGCFVMLSWGEKDPSGETPPSSKQPQASKFAGRATTNSPTQNWLPSQVSLKLYIIIGQN